MQLPGMSAALLLEFSRDRTVDIGDLGVQSEGGTVVAEPVTAR
jgi:hypothetical protein